MILLLLYYICIVILFKTIGSILFIIHPFGCLLSGVLQGRFGKKYCMIFANIPSIIGWTLLYLAHSSLFLYASTLLMGFSIGIGAGAVHAYVGEITEPRLRGAMASLTNTAALFGMLVSFTLSSFFDWRTVALLSTLCPIICILLIIFVREILYYIIYYEINQACSSTFSFSLI